MRPWREVATEIANEQDPDRLLELCRELSRVLDAQDKLKGGTSWARLPH